MDPLRRMFEHHRWATLVLIDHLAALPPETLRLELPGTRGDIGTTMAHIVGADARYLARLEGTFEAGSGPAPIDEGLPLAELRSRFERQAQTWLDLVPRAAELDVFLAARGDWPDTPHAEDLMFLQAIHHGNDHRTHICSILGAAGIEPPEIDGWSYWAATQF